MVENNLGGGRMSLRDISYHCCTLIQCVKRTEAQQNIACAHQDHVL